MRWKIFPGLVLRQRTVRVISDAFNQKRIPEEAKRQRRRPFQEKIAEKRSEILGWFLLAMPFVCSLGRGRGGAMAVGTAAGTVLWRRGRDGQNSNLLLDNKKSSQF